MFSKKCLSFVMTFLNVKGDLKCGASLIFKISERDDTFYVDVMVWTKLSMARTANIIRLWIKVIWMTKYFTQSILEKEIIINEKAFLILLLNRQQVSKPGDITDPVLDRKQITVLTVNLIQNVGWANFDPVRTISFFNWPRSFRAKILSRLRLICRSIFMAGLL